jgi:hypothetical protein
MHNYLEALIVTRNEEEELLEIDETPQWGEGESHNACSARQGPAFRSLLTPNKVKC